MRIKKKSFVSKLLIGASSLMIVMWIFRGNSPVLTQQTIPRDTYLGQIQGVILNFSEKLTAQTQKCVSSAGNIKVTANFTINELLDSMRLTFLSDGLHGEATMKQPEAVPADTRGIEKAPLEVIVIPHSHNDPGWKKTYMKYYEDQTKHILDLIVEKLNQYTDMTFIWVESCFLNTWWANQTRSTQEMFRELVKSGRLELVSGMWVAPDEASTHYFALVDQLIEGHYWMKENIGVIPETSLNFDQFGYSTSIPYLMKKSGLKHVLIKRIHRGVKHVMGKNKWMAFNWRQFWDPDGKNDIFTQVDTYEWMSISDSCGPDRTVCRGLDFTIMPDLPVPGSPAALLPFVYDRMTGSRANNLHDFVQRVVGQFKLKSANYQQKVMMLPHGGDFHYSTPEPWDRQYKNMKLFMQYVNEHKDEFNVHMRFGTFKDYFTELEKQKKQFGISLPTISGDFFTYTESNEYWTGYYTTRQFDKRLGREVLESLRAAELLSAILFLDKTTVNILPDVKKSMLSKLERARQDLGIFQHHDAITGTSQEHVAVDYEKRLSSAFTSTQEVLSSAVEFLVQDGEPDESETKTKPVLLRTGYNKLTDTVPIKVPEAGINLIFLNSFTQSRQEILSVTFATSDVVLYDEADNLVKFDIISQTRDKTVIMFEVTFPAVGLLVFTVKQKAGDQSMPSGSKIPELVSANNKFVCENKHVNITFSKTTGSPEVMCYKSKNLCSKIEIDWRYYKGHGGAYTMMSNGIEVPASDSPPVVKTVKGRTVCGISSTFNYFSVFLSLPLTSGITGKALKVNIYSDLSEAPSFNGDLAMRVQTDVQNNGTFYVDSNGMQLMGRKFRNSLPFDGNVYPMSAMAMIEDSRARLVVHSAQPHGVISKSSGVLDFMIDRIALRPEMDMPEAVKDNKPTKTILYIEFQSAAEYERLHTQETALPSVNSVYLNDIVQHPIYTFYTLANIAISQNSHSFLRHPVSADVVIANLKNLLNEQSESDGISMTLFRRAVSCGLKTKDTLCRVFDNINIRPGELIGRTTGSGVMSREVYLSHLMEKQSVFSDDNIDLRPMDIKTFHIK